jgi:type VI secretion system protein ImpG
LLTEFFAFPPKFWFFDLGDFAQVRRAGFGKSLEITLFLRRTLTGMEQAVSAETFRLGCTPIVNLFEQSAEPIRLTQARYEYRVVPDVAQPLGMEVFTIDSVQGLEAGRPILDYQPFYSFRHGQDRNQQRTFWYARRQASLLADDAGTEVYLNLVDLDFDLSLPAESVLIVQTTCTNRNLPLLLARAGQALQLELEAAAPIVGVRCLRSPSFPLRPPLGKGAYWRLLSHLNLNHLSLTEAEEGRQALQEILRLYDFSDPVTGQQLGAVTQQLIEGITAVSSRRVVGRIGGPTASGFCRGFEVAIEFDEQKYAGTGVFLFACVLERFLALYATMNCFTQLVACTKEGMVKKWPPRIGEHRLL